jgi:hypothetical protein
MVLEQLWERTDSGASLHFSRILLAVTKDYLRTQVEQTESISHRAVSLITFNLPYSDDLISFRNRVWDCVFSLASVPSLRREALDVIYHYSTHGLEVNNHDVIRADSLRVREFLSTAIDPSDYSETSIALSFYKFLDTREIPYDKREPRKLESKTTKLARLLTPGFTHRKSLEEQETEQIYALKRLTSRLKHADLDGFFSQCIAIHKTLQSRNEWQLQRGLAQFFTVIGEHRPRLFVSALRKYLKLGDPFSLQHIRGIASALIRTLGATKALSFINEHEFSRKPLWHFDVLTSIPPEKLTLSHIDAIYAIYSESTPESIPTLDSRALEPYLSTDKRLIAEIVRILLSRMERENNKVYASPLFLVFNPHVATREKLASYFPDNDFSLLKRAYMISQQANDHSDYDGRVFNLILDLDRRFLREYLENVAMEAKTSKHGYLGRFDARKFDFLWERDDFKNVISDAFLFLYELSQDDSLYLDFYSPSLFCANHEQEDEKVSPELAEKRVKVLGGLIAENSEDDDFMHFVFQVVGALSEDERRRLVKEFLARNKSVETFRRLSLEVRSKAYSGSAVPVFQKDYDFLESILSMLQGVELLEHKLYLERRLEGLRQYIESEKKRDFMRD